MTPYTPAEEACARHAAKLIGYERGRFYCVRFAGTPLMLEGWQIVALEWLDGFKFCYKAAA